jgi:predicted nucleic acid-binding protein
MPPVGRRQAERNVFSFEGRLLSPPELVIDTSFVVDALVAAQPRHDACRAFLDAIRDSGSVVYFNRLLVVELWEAAYTIKLRERHGGRWRGHRHDRRSLRPAKTLRDTLHDAWRAALQGLNIVVVDLGEVVERVPEFMSYGLGSSDAVHAATAAYVDVQPFVTLDYHFSLVPERQLELYVPQKRVSACRKRRASLTRG